MSRAEPLVWPVLALIAGILCSRFLPFVQRDLWIGFAALTVLAAFALWKVSERTAWMAGLAAVFLLGILVEVRKRSQPRPEIDFTPDETMILAGCVVEPPRLSQDREQFVIELDRDARVRVNWHLEEGEQPPVLRYGQRVELEARLRKPRNYGNPGSFDFAGYLARRDIYWLASANRRSRLEILDGQCGSRTLSILYRWREKSLDRLDDLLARDPYALGMSRAILLGDTAKLNEVWTQDFRRTGTYHALVISGLHLTVLAACFLFPIRLLGVGPGWSLVWTSILAWAYACMAGGGAPVVRAAAGLTLYLIGRCFYRRPSILNLLAAVAGAFLLADPDELLDASFQMSFLSVAIIGGVAVPLLDRTTQPFARGITSLNNLNWDLFLPPKVAQMRVEMRLLAETVEWMVLLPKRITLWVFSGIGRATFFTSDLLVVSTAVQLGLALPMVLYFHRISITGATANLLVAPLMNLVIPLGFLGILTGWQPLADVCAALLHTARAVAGWHAEREWMERIPDPPGWVAAWLLGGLLLAAFSMRRRWWVGAASGLLFAGGLGLMIGHPFKPLSKPGWMEVTALDVGQGDSLLVGSPQGSFLLVDAGGVPVFGRMRKAPVDVGEDVVSAYLFTRGIRRLDVIVVTHAHEDHIGGLTSVVENFRPREVWTGAFPETDSWIALRNWLVSRGVKVVTPKAGERKTWAGVEVEILSPPFNYETGRAPRNNDSLAMRFRHGERSYLLTGDIERAMERRMVGDGLVAKSDVLKVAHHGSKTSTNREFLEAASPRWAVISDGAYNIFRHPHPDVLGRLDQAGVRVWRTDQQGQVRFRTDGRSWEVETFLWPVAEESGLLRQPVF